MRHGCLCEERSGELWGEELPGPERSPGRRTRGRAGRKPAGKFSGRAPTPAATPLAAASAPRSRLRLLTGKLGGSVDFKLLPPPQLDPK